MVIVRQRYVLLVVDLSCFLVSPDEAHAGVPTCNSKVKYLGHLKATFA